MICSYETLFSSSVLIEAEEHVLHVVSCNFSALVLLLRLCRSYQRK